jgi:thioredoxin-related protein
MAAKKNTQTKNKNKKKTIVLVKKKTCSQCIQNKEQNKRKGKKRLRSCLSWRINIVKLEVVDGFWMKMITL